jgi:hypothetical protein
MSRPPSHYSISSTEEDTPQESGPANASPAAARFQRFFEEHAASSTHELKEERGGTSRFTRPLRVIQLTILIQGRALFGDAQFESLREYVLRGRAVSYSLQAILSNDLFDAAKTLDSNLRPRLADLAEWVESRFGGGDCPVTDYASLHRFVYDEVPGLARGSGEAYTDWCFRSQKEREKDLKQEWRPQWDAWPWDSVAIQTVSQVKEIENLIAQKM